MPSPSQLLFVIDGKPGASYARLSLLKKSIEFDVLNVDLRFSASYDPCAKYNWSLSQAGREFVIHQDITKIVFFPRSFEKLGSFPFVIGRHRNYEKRQWLSLWRYFEFCTRTFTCMNHPSRARIAANRLYLLDIARIASVPTAWTAVMGGATSFGNKMTVPISTSIIAKTLSDTTDISATASAYPIVIDINVIRDLANSSPIILQEKIHIRSQFRAYFFCLKLITIEIKTNSKEIDYRYDERSVDNYTICLNDQVAEAMNKIIPILNIDFGAIDFIHDGHRLVLIDINPHGTWNWLPASVRAPIDAAYLRFISDWMR